MKAHHLTAFEQMTGAMRQRLRPTKANLFADQLRIYVGLNCAETDENHLLKMLLQELSLSLGHLACGGNNPGQSSGDLPAANVVPLAHRKGLARPGIDHRPPSQHCSAHAERSQC
jgi:hypothetical protein